MSPEHNGKPANGLGDTADSVCRRFADSTPPKELLDADLARLVDAWPTLPAHVKAACLALVATATGQ